MIFTIFFFCNKFSRKQKEENFLQLTDFSDNAILSTDDNIAFRYSHFFHVFSFSFFSRLTRNKKIDNKFSRIFLSLLGFPYKKQDRKHFFLVHENFVSISERKREISSVKNHFSSKSVKRFSSNCVEKKV